MHIIIACAAISGILVFSAYTQTTATAFASDGTNTMSPDNLRPGDFLLTGTDDTIFDWLIPGKWSHSLMFGGVTTAYGQVWDTENGCWLGAGVPWVIHSTQGGSAMASGRPSWDDDSGLRTSSFQEVINNHAGNVVAIRILKPGGVTLTVSEENALVSFCTSKIYSTNGYDWNWLGMQTGIDHAFPYISPKGYYCSEVLWAAAKVVLGIDMDGDFSPFNIGVSPEDLYWSSYASVIALEMNSDPNGNSVPGGAYKVDASNDLYKVTGYLYEVQYDNDHDPWPSGKGEMYLKAYIGEAYFPSCAATGDQSDTNWDKIDDANDDYWTRGTGNTYWYGQHYGLVSYDSYVKVRFVPSEYDPTSSDDDYPAFQWWFSPSTWHNYVNNGWYYSGWEIDYGDIRYTVYFRIDSCY